MWTEARAAADGLYERLKANDFQHVEDGLKALGERMDRMGSRTEAMEAWIGERLERIEARRREEAAAMERRIVEAVAAGGAEAPGVNVASACLLAWRPNSVRRARGRRVRDPLATACVAVARHHRKRFGEPVQTGLAKRGQREFIRDWFQSSRREREPPPIPVFGDVTVAKVWTGSFITNAVGNGMAGSPKGVPIRVLNCASAFPCLER